MAFWTLAQAPMTPPTEPGTVTHKANPLWQGLGMLVGLGVGLAGYSVLHEPLDIRLDMLRIRLRDVGGKLPARGLRILHLSDTHFQGITWREQAKIDRIRRLTAGLEYDLLVHTGDFWHNEEGLQNILTLLDNIPRPRLGSYGVLGNHDYACYSHSDMWSRNWAHYQAQAGQAEAQANGNGHGAKPRATLHNLVEFYRFAKYFLNVPFVLKRIHFNDHGRLRATLADRGFQILHNELVHLRHQPDQPDGVDLYLAGVDDVSEGQPDVQKAFANVQENKPLLLLSHNPDILRETRAWQADVVLSGHTHGGQVTFPWLGAVHTHSAHLRRHEASGYLRRGKTHVYVTRGVGEGIPLRFRARPQITLVTVRGQ
jgi:predicted MPP superfamily phosphohydrolase